MSSIERFYQIYCRNYVFYFINKKYLLKLHTLIYKNKNCTDAQLKKQVLPTSIYQPSGNAKKKYLPISKQFFNLTTFKVYFKVVFDFLRIGFTYIKY